MKFRELQRIVGEHIPGGMIPAAWWVSTDEAQLEAFDRWKFDYNAHHKKVMELAAKLDCEEANIISFGNQTWLSGFVPTADHAFLSGQSRHFSTPYGWRIDSKKNLLVPVRRTKADRKSLANQEFDAVKKVPNVRAYLTGIPTEIVVEIGDGRSSVYGAQYFRGDHCVMAFSGGDPDRSRRPVVVDSAVWKRQKVTALTALREAAA